MLSSLVNDFQNDEVTDPRSDTLLFGRPCFEDTWVTCSGASSSAVNEVVVGMKTAILVRRSTTARMELSSEVGRNSIRSIDIDDQGEGDSAVGRAGGSSSTGMSSDDMVSVSSDH